MTRGLEEDFFYTSSFVNMLELMNQDITTECKEVYWSRDLEDVLSNELFVTAIIIILICFPTPRKRCFSQIRINALKLSANS